MAYAPDGRQLSPGEVYEETAEQVVAEEWREDRNVVLICPDCKEDPPQLFENFSTGDLLCDSCGLVFMERCVDTRSEWRTFSNDDANNDDPSRVGEAANPLLHGSQLHTEISFGDGGLRVRELSRAQNKSSQDKSNTSLQLAYAQISALCESSAIPKTVADTTKTLFKLTDDAKLLKGKSQDAIIAGCIFIACRQHSLHRSFREIFKLTKVTKKEIGRTFKTLEAFIKKATAKDQAKLKGAIPSAASSFKHTPTTSAADLILRACNKLNLNNKISIIAQEAATNVNNNGVAAGRSPLSITGACIYLVAHMMGAPRPAKDIGLAVDVSDGTIRTSYKLICESLHLVEGPDWVQRGADMSLIPGF